MDWISLKDSKQLEEIVAESKERPVLIYKHSTRCNISRATFDRLERNWNASAVGSVKRYFLDLIFYRDISNKIAEIFQVEHHSPQILVISQGKSVLDLSHYDIDFDQIKSVLEHCQAGKIDMTNRH
ncbi:MAG: bacillithiol system redox-active protein YtxJ [Cyclobacteriaceae bacterium]